MATDAREIVNTLLRQIQERENLNDEALARKLDVDPVTIYRWRKGGIGKAASILIPLVLSEHTDKQAA